ncbi:MAG: IS30 family transposase, partial [Actinobacteria bacterium]
MAVFTDAERIEVWDRRAAGELNRSIGRSLGRTGASIRALIESTGGVRPAVRKRCVQHLTLVEREEISRGLATNESLCEIAQRLGRAPSTVSREVARNGGRDKYRAHRADRTAFRRARRPKPSKLFTNEVLRGAVEDKLADRWSPQQISGWLRHTYRDNEGMHVSHETIYLSLFVQSRGALKRELTQHLCTRR